MFILRDLVYLAREAAGAFTEGLALAWHATHPSNDAADQITHGPAWDDPEEFWAPLDPDEDADPPLMDWERDLRQRIAGRSSCDDDELIRAWKAGELRVVSCDACDTDHPTQTADGAYGIAHGCGWIPLRDYDPTSSSDDAPLFPGVESWSPFDKYGHISPALGPSVPTVTTVKPLTAEQKRLFREAFQSSSRDGAVTADPVREESPAAAASATSAAAGHPKLEWSAACGLRMWANGEPCTAPTYFKSIAHDLEQFSK